MKEALIPKHGGYRKLKTFKLAHLVYELTVWFCGRHLPREGGFTERLFRFRSAGGSR